ncbi:hypothetical protein bcere0022_48880 [Bacillus cereus Rock3-44]|nr:hypothetical protein bcere0022_48880 [Bacillus cereus Rock3-44]
MWIEVRTRENENYFFAIIYISFIHLYLKGVFHKPNLWL